MRKVRHPLKVTEKEGYNLLLSYTFILKKGRGCYLIHFLKNENLTFSSLEMLKNAKITPRGGTAEKSLKWGGG